MKKITSLVKLQILPGKATPAPPIGSSLGQHGLNIMSFCKNFNENSKRFDPNLKVQVLVRVYSDKTFDFDINNPTVADLLKSFSGITTGSKLPGKNESVIKISMSDVKKIAEIKFNEINAYTLNNTIKVVEGTARSVGMLVTN